MERALIEIRGLAKSFPARHGRTQVLRHVDLEVREGEFVAVVGFSGTGKSTLVNLIAGLATADAGEILVDGKPIRGAGPDRAVVFQSYALLPWMTVLENVRLAVDAVFADWPAERRRAHAEANVELVGLSAAMRKYPGELSGGMRQRVAVARALAMSPRILLLDEPLGALDALTRATMQREIARIWALHRKTVLLITNDVEEGILLADRVIPLEPGAHGASLGQSFTIDLERPRDRVRLNQDPRFVGLRNRIVTHLAHLRGPAEARRRAS